MLMDVNYQAGFCPCWHSTWQVKLSDSTAHARTTPDRILRQCIDIYMTQFKVFVDTTLYSNGVMSVDGTNDFVRCLVAVDFQNSTL